MKKLLFTYCLACSLLLAKTGDHSKPNFQFKTKSIGSENHPEAKQSFFELYTNQRNDKNAYLNAKKNRLTHPITQAVIKHFPTVIGPNQDLAIVLAEGIGNNKLFDPLEGAKHYHNTANAFEQLFGGLPNIKDGNSILTRLDQLKEKRDELEDETKRLENIKNPKKEDRLLTTFYELATKHADERIKIEEQGKEYEKPEGKGVDPEYRNAVADAVESFSQRADEDRKNINLAAEGDEDATEKLWQRHKDQLPTWAVTQQTDEARIKALKVLGKGKDNRITLWKGDEKIELNLGKDNDKKALLASHTKLSQLVKDGFTAVKPMVKKQPAPITPPTTFASSGALNFSPAYNSQVAPRTPTNQFDSYGNPIPGPIDLSRSQVDRAPDQLNKIALDIIKKGSCTDCHAMSEMKSKINSGSKSMLAQMPPTGPKLTSQEIATLESWAKLP